MQKHNEDNLTQKRRFNLLCDEIHFGKYVYFQMSYKTIINVGAVRILKITCSAEMILCGHGRLEGRARG